jgi:hypothetical protein
MTQHATDTYGTVYKNGDATFMARVLGNRGQPIRQADIGSIDYSVYLLDDQDADWRSPVPGHDQIAIRVADAVFDALQADPPWDAALDADGYNFCHTPDVSANAAFPIAGRRYLVEYRLAPSAGQTILIRFRLNVI